VLKHERVLSSVVNKRVERKQGIMDERVKTGAEKRVDEKKKAKFDEVKRIKKDQIGNNKQVCLILFLWKIDRQIENC
jgi:hypothetical protein